jgi:ribosomal protein S18 acetylase RimI-like enzyme
MVEAHFVPYDEKRHRDQFLQMNIEAVIWEVNEVSRIYGINTIPPGENVAHAVRDYIEEQLLKYAAIKPPKGIIYILEVDGEAMGMGALRKQEDGVGEIKRMYNRPKVRGRGFGQEMLKRLEKKAKEFGYSTLRLDTRADSAAALHIYRKAGFKERGAFPVEAPDVWTETEGIKVYMEKKL